MYLFRIIQCIFLETNNSLNIYLHLRNPFLPIVVCATKIGYASCFVKNIIVYFTSGYMFRKKKHLFHKHETLIFN